MGRSNYLCSIPKRPGLSNSVDVKIRIRSHVLVAGVYEIFRKYEGQLSVRS